MIAIVDAGIGNVGSIVNMLRTLGEPACVTSDAAALERADKLILPGVGAFDHGMRQLHRHDLVSVLNHVVCERGAPILGICLGMQLFGLGSEEGRERGLEWIDGHSVRFAFREGAPTLRIPHMGWNSIELAEPSHLLAGLGQEARFYFVHSYHVVCRNPRHVAGRTWYGYDFTSAIASGNILGVQFHPEKSHRHGMALLRAFARM